MSTIVPEGYFRDSTGELLKDRRIPSPDRRSPRSSAYDGDRRNRLRRRTDLVHQKREADQQIEEALETFAEEHGD